MKHTSRGFSLIEILVVMLIFSVIAIVTTQTLLVSLTSTRKSQSNTRVRENLEYVVSVMERHIRNANSINTTECTPARISFIDENNLPSAFSCDANAVNSSSGQLTSEQIEITNCNFVCHQASGGVPDYVEINITGRGKDLSSSESTPVSISTRIQLRVY